MTARPKPLHVAVVGGGTSCEHDVSLASAAAAGRSLVTAGHDVTMLTIGPDGGWCGPGGPMSTSLAVLVLQDHDVVLPVVHGPGGEDGTLAALCEVLGVPYVGCGLTAGAIAMDKAATKAVAAQVGLLTAHGQVVHRPEQAVWSGACVVKPCRAGSSHGVTLVERPQDLQPAVRAALALDSRALVEEVLHGREVDVAVIDRPDGTRLVPPALEIVHTGIFDLTAKYDGSADFRLPARLTPHEREAVEAAAVAMYDALGCRGLARVDFFVTADGPVLNEVNTMPGLTEHSQLPRMAQAAGLDHPALLDLLVRTATGG